MRSSIKCTKTRCPHCKTLQQTWLHRGSLVCCYCGKKFKVEDNAEGTATTNGGRFPLQ